MKMKKIGSLLTFFNWPKATFVQKTYRTQSLRLKASDNDKLAEFGQNPAEFDDNDDIILLYLEMCLIT